MLTIFSTGCAPAIEISPTDNVNRIEIFDQKGISSRIAAGGREALDKPTSIVSDPKRISHVLAFLRERNRLWHYPPFETPGSRYTITFYDGDDHRFVIWLGEVEICGRSSGEYSQHNRCRYIRSADVAELKRLLEIE
ncbi:MAG TPA: hypothetical protein VGQ55_02415 [Pyrinomonadaceae bacterium]|nr:hypothetical protein [Pyrinomonadaceae bacterium]